MNTTKDNPCSCELRAFFSERFQHTRSDLHLSQMEFAEELNIDRRSYIDLEHNKSLCCATTLIIYLCYHCDDPVALLADCRAILDRNLASSKRQP